MREARPISHQRNEGKTVADEGNLMGRDEDSIPYLNRIRECFEVGGFYTTSHCVVKFQDVVVTEE